MGHIYDNNPAMEECTSPEGVMSKLFGALFSASRQSAWNEANLIFVLSSKHLGKSKVGEELAS